MPSGLLPRQRLTHQRVAGPERHASGGHEPPAPCADADNLSHAWTACQLVRAPARRTTIRVNAVSHKDAPHRWMACPERQRSTHLTLWMMTRFQEIIATAQAIGADLIIMGTHGRTGLRHALMGSVAEKVVRLAPCAVLVPRSSGEAMPTRE
jgi:hypothetical protein